MLKERMSDGEDEGRMAELGRHRDAGENALGESGVSRPSTWAGGSEQAGMPHSSWGLDRRQLPS